MKKIMKAAAAMAVLATPAFAVNLENPLYAPKAGEAYSKTGIGLMYKIADDTEAQVKKNHDGATEFPIWRAQEDLGIGITDRLFLTGQFGYTHNDDVARKGMHLGRLGPTYRIFADASEIVWDVYAEAHVGGVSKMTGTMGATGFKYDNYGTGQYGVYAGTKVGKTWDNLTGALYAEVGYYFPGDNNEIDIVLPAGYLPGYPLPINGSAKAELKSFVDWSIGTKWTYDFDTKWTAGLGLAWKHHGNHEVESAKVKSGAPSIVNAGLEKQFKNYDFEDSFEEFPVTLLLANQLTDNVQVSVYGEYTFDSGDKGSQNSTDTKAEIGARVNVQF